MGLKTHSRAKINLVKIYAFNGHTFKILFYICSWFNITPQTL